MFIRSLIIAPILLASVTLNAQVISDSEKLRISFLTVQLSPKPYSDGVIVTEDLLQPIENSAFQVTGVSVEKEVPADTFDNYSYPAGKKSERPMSQLTFAPGIIHRISRPDYRSAVSNHYRPKISRQNEISKTLYRLIDMGFSGRSVFPKCRAGFSLYSNLPGKFEMEGGLRYLNFGNSTHVYTGYLGKYYKRFLFGLRTFVSPGTTAAANCYSFTSRYYMRSKGDFISVSVGSGLSHDERSLNIKFINKSRINSQLASAGYSHCFTKKSLVSLHAAWVNNQYNSSFIAHQLDVSAGIQRKF